MFQLGTTKLRNRLPLIRALHTVDISLRNGISISHVPSLESRVGTPDTQSNLIRKSLESRDFLIK